VADVLEAVTYVSGIDPLRMGRTTSTIRARRLAIHSLRQITECSWPEVALSMGYAQHSTPMRLAGTEPPNVDDLRAVIERVSEKVGA
jgi:hypothetical protein